MSITDRFGNGPSPEDGRDALREALRQIRDYEPKHEEFRLDNDGCPDCKRNRERNWPPSGLCEKHYGQAANNRDRRERTEARQHYDMREIARAALAASPGPTAARYEERSGETVIRCEATSGPHAELRCLRFKGHDARGHLFDDPEIAALWNGMNYWYRKAWELEGANIVNRNAVRLQKETREAAERARDELQKTPPAAALQLIEDLAEAQTEQDAWDVQARARAFLAPGGRP